MILIIFIIGFVLVIMCRPRMDAAGQRALAYIRQVTALQPMLLDEKRSMTERLRIGALALALAEHALAEARKSNGVGVDVPRLEAAIRLMRSGLAQATEASKYELPADLADYGLTDEELHALFRRKS
jgi:hypothetical protein